MHHFVLQTKRTDKQNGTEDQVDSIADHLDHLTVTATQRHDMDGVDDMDFGDLV